MGHPVVSSVISMTVGLYNRSNIFSSRQSFSNGLMCSITSDSGEDQWMIRLFKVGRLVQTLSVLNCERYSHVKLWYDCIVTTVTIMQIIKTAK